MLGCFLETLEEGCYIVDGAYTQGGSSQPLASCSAHIATRYNLAVAYWTSLLWCAMKLCYEVANYPFRSWELMVLYMVYCL